jgi:23S rRNA pseudouridine2605 synthase
MLISPACFSAMRPVAPAPVTSILQHAGTRLPRQGGNTDPMAERLQKFLAQAGYGSRREIENWIREGKISVNDKPAELGVSVTADDRIRIDGRLVASASQMSRPPRTMAYHKPAGELTTRKDTEGRPTVFDNLPKIRSGRWISVGRLDFNTAGLLLVTTDGELAHRLMHPSWQVEREYAVRILGEVDEAVLQQLQEGVMLDDGMAAFASIKDAGGQGMNHWYHVTVREGRNREVRRLWESQGLTVSRLKRVRYGEIFIPSRVKQGQWAEMEAAEIKSLYRMANLPMKEVRRATIKEREVMERQFGKRQGRGVAKKGSSRKHKAT